MKKISRRKLIGQSVSGSIGSYIALNSKKTKAASAGLDFSPYILVIHCDGGWDSTMVFDNKLSSANVDTQPGCYMAQGASDILYVKHSSRPSVDQFFNDFGSKAAILNGVSTGVMNHKLALKNSMAYNFPKTNRPTDWLSFYGGQIGGILTLPHVSINAPYIPGLYGKYSTKITSSSIADHTAGTLSNPYSLAAESTDSLKEFLQSRYSKMLEDNITDTLDSEKIQTLYSSFTQEEYVESAVKQVSFDPTESQLVNDGLLAVNLFKNGYSQAITLQSGSDMAWDSHKDNFSQQSTQFESLFDSLNKILNMADSAGILDKMTVVVKSDLGRSPKLNANDGKDHWSYNSVLLWGAGIKGGQVIGSTNDFQIGNLINPTFGAPTGFGDIVIDMRHIAAALIQFFGIPYTLMFPDVEPAYTILSQEG